MGRILGTKPMYEAADLFRRRCLVEGRSFLWPEYHAWTLERISALRNVLARAGQKDFFGQWREQLAEQPEEVHRVATDIVAFYHLFGTKAGPKKRLDDVRRVVGWKLGQDPPEIGFLERAYSEGYQSSGMLLPPGRPQHVDFYLRFAQEVFSRGIDTTDVDACKRLANELKEWGTHSGTAANLLLHLFFPEYIEDIGADEHKQRIVEAFQDRSGGADDLDEALLNVRCSLAEAHGEHFDFYNEDVYRHWAKSRNRPEPGPLPDGEGEHVADRGPLNVILYGPPGTGKTYRTQRRAVEILEPGADDLLDSDISARFREYLNDERIEFVTFHPSYSYEEFVEGFRYDPDAKVPVLHDGVFKRLVTRALNPRHSTAVAGGARIWKVSLGDDRAPDLFERCMHNGEIAIGWFPHRDLTGYTREDIADLFDEGATNSINSVDYFVNGIRDGDYVAVFKNQREIRAIGVVSGGYRYKRVYGDQQPHIRPVKWLDRRDHDIVAINGFTNLTRTTVYPLNRISLQEFVELLPEQERAGEPHILIIDEINRGNLSRIFGELITLLEEDKRRGAPNELSARLPYSRKPFTIPSNVYVIGTMNTADRSIALIDTALRRRFQFREMRPDSGVIREALGTTTRGDEKHVELVCKVFDTLNQRIAVLLDRDHQIGHSYFLEAASLEELHRTLYSKVFPLLQEYFYNDPERLRRVLGAYEPARQKGFVESLQEYKEAFEDPPDEEPPWEFHEYPLEEFNSALQNTFRIS